MIPKLPIRDHIRPVAGVFGTLFRVAPTAPRRVFVARPNPPIYGDDGQRLDVPQGTANEGHGELVAWLHEVGAEAPRYAWVVLPSSQEPHEFPVAWVHDAGNIPAIRVDRARPWQVWAA